MQAEVSQGQQVTHERCGQTFSLDVTVRTWWQSYKHMEVLYGDVPMLQAEVEARGKGQGSAREEGEAVDARHIDKDGASGRHSAHWCNGSVPWSGAGGASSGNAGNYRGLAVNGRVGFPADAAVSSGSRAEVRRALRTATGVHPATSQYLGRPRRLVEFAIDTRGGRGPSRFPPPFFFSTTVISIYSFGAYGYYSSDFVQAIDGSMIFCYT